MLEYVDRESRVSAPRRADLSGDDMIKTTTFLFAALVAAPALAADLPAAAPAAAAPAPAATNTTIGLELSPEFIALTTDPHYGALTDGYVKGTITETVAPGWSVSGIAQYTLKGLKPGSASQTSQYQLEGNVAYKAKLSDVFSFTGTGGLGYAFGNTGYTGGSPSPAGTDPFFYWYLSGAVDAKLDSHWTLNLVNFRIRDSFTVAWWTPKIQTGVTYNIDSANAVYGNVGYAWKDSTGGYAFTPDKYNLAVGYKHSF